MEWLVHLIELCSMSFKETKPQLCYLVTCPNFSTFMLEFTLSKKPFLNIATSLLIPSTPIIYVNFTVRSANLDTFVATGLFLVGVMPGLLSETNFAIVLTTWGMFSPL